MFISNMQISHISLVYSSILTLVGILTGSTICFWSNCLSKSLL